MLAQASNRQTAMADIFISYASKDRPIARRLAEALEACGWSVWWDYRGLRGGQHFDRIIEEEISKAMAVIVVWSQNSINSDWVRAEASHGLHEKKLAPVRIDSATLPLRFRNIHTLDLSFWTRESETEPFERLLETLSDYLGPPKKAAQPSRRAEHRSRAEPADVAAIHAAYERGDYETALRLARPAAEQGFAWAQNNLGVLYAQGRGAVQDDTEAARWYRKAADQGLAAAQTWLGWLYQNGRGVPQDEAHAVQWYRKAAEQGEAAAQKNLDLLSAKKSR
jgi:hypothetical protein